MRLRDLAFAYPGLQPLAYRLDAIVDRASGLFRQQSGAKLALQAPILLIVGCGRSGNTLLRRTLMERGRIYIPPESYVWASEAHAFLRSSALSWPDQVALVLGKFEYMQEFDKFETVSLREFALAATKWEGSKRTLGGLIHGLYFWLAQQKGIDADWVGDKTPMNLARIGVISRIFPEARYVYIERDPVDVVLSYRAAGLYSTLEEAARRWKLSHEAWRRFRLGVSPARRIEIKFQALVEDRDATADGVLAAMGIERRSRAIDVARALGDVNMLDHHRVVRTGTPPAHAPNARPTLTDAERVSLRKALGNLPSEAGYEPV